MARKKRPSRVRPKTPARIKKRKRKPRGQRHPELVGLGLLALGLFLGSVLYLGWNGGYVGGALADGLRWLIGAAAYAFPPTAVVVGTLMVARSALVDVRPFRTGLAILTAGLLLTLGDAHGGEVGHVLDQVV